MTLSDLTQHFHPNASEGIVIILCAGFVLAFLGLKLINFLHRIALRRSNRKFRLRTDQYTRMLSQRQAKEREGNRYMNDGGI